jgi:hypothetical protein
MLPKMKKSRGVKQTTPPKSSVAVYALTNCSQEIENKRATYPFDEYDFFRYFSFSFMG